MKWSSNKVRETFLKYFRERDHVIVPSSSLLPKNDPTLLFTNAGMNQFKLFFLGVVKPPFTRAASCQKCLRAGGKHNDLDNVGFTKRHHTFFEMLGNFSFNDYFKEDAIKFAWELLTEIYGLEKERLWVTVYKEDDEAYNIWKDIIGIQEERIVRLGEKDNFWEMGEQGPAGPCSEILYDLGVDADPKQATPEMEGERFLEIWNLVFMQYNRNEKGELEKLGTRNIDTGMGLERLLRVLNGADSNFHTDLFMPIIEEVERITGVKYYGDERGSAHRVLADHTRALTFAISDGIYPSNYGRGYVLRRILRRAHRFAQKIGYGDKPIIYRLVPVVVEVMKDAYPELTEKKAEVEFIIKREEERFIENIAKTLPKLEMEVEEAKASGVLSGKVVFKFYDTYGLPLDLIEEYAKDAGLTIDWSSFEEEMEIQREQARKTEVFKVDIPEKWTILREGQVKFIGYEKLETLSKILKYGSKGEKIYIVTEETPFYPEGGGQVGDKGIIEGEGPEGHFLVEVFDTKKIENQIIHIGRLIEGKIQDVEVRLVVDEKLRKAAQRAHTATHLLHAALREVLGEHVRQEGSLVEPDRLRFDFLHFSKLRKEEIEEIERIVNTKIIENIPLTIKYMKYDEAVRDGAMALFEGKYGEIVRVIHIGDFSRELCGGTHAERTGDIGLFKIIKEEASSANIRRIEAHTGLKAIQYIQRLEETVMTAAETLSTTPDKLTEKIEKNQEIMKSLEEEVKTYLTKWADLKVREIIEKQLKTEKFLVFTEYIKNADINALRAIADRIRATQEKGLVILISSKGNNVFFLVEVLGNIEGVDASSLVKTIGKYFKGGGGGSKTKAEGGGKDASKIGEVLDMIKTGKIFTQEV
uniref:Alanine--tRNA ligase n=1 Tax=candidate division WOR-3 bacterium TaxID=2052148 RepID=A0A7V3ZZ75_UNCW3